MCLSPNELQQGQVCLSGPVPQLSVPADMPSVGGEYQDLDKIFFIVTVRCSMFIAVPTLYKISTILLFADSISVITDIGITYPDERDGTLFFVQRVKECITVFTIGICW